MSRVHNLGMVRDMAQRKTLARIDDDSRRGKVAVARRLIYEKQYQVDSAAVEGLLKDQSLVPTTVSVWAVCDNRDLLMATPERILGIAISTWF